MTCLESEPSPVEPTTLAYRLATLDDLPDLQSLMGEMLHELAPLGHDIRPTERNLVIYIDRIFAPAIEADNHGIVIAYDNLTPVGATFFTPEETVFDVPAGRVITHGIYVRPDWRCTRAVFKMLALATARLKDLGYTQLLNYVLHANEGGNALSRYLRSTPLGTQTLTLL